MKLNEPCWAVAENGAVLPTIFESKPTQWDESLVVRCVIIEAERLKRMRELSSYTICELLDEILCRVEMKTVGIPKSDANRYYRFHVQHSLNSLDYERFGNQPRSALAEMEDGK